MKKMVGFGDYMLRLNPAGSYIFLYFFCSQFLVS